MGSIFKLCEQYSEIFHLEGDTLTFTNAAEHVIKIKENQTPIYRTPYRLPHSQQEEISKQLKKLEDDDIIEKSMSPWNAPIILIKKKADFSGVEKFRIVVDFRTLNQVTLNEFHPLPNITEILDQLGQCQLFSVIDLASGILSNTVSKGITRVNSVFHRGRPLAFQAYGYAYENVTSHFSTINEHSFIRNNRN